MRSFNTWLNKGYFSLQAASLLAGTSPQGLYKLGAKGKIKLTLVNGTSRVLVSDLESYLQEEKGLTLSEAISGSKPPVYLKKYLKAKAQENETNKSTITENS